MGGILRRMTSSVYRLTILAGSANLLRVMVFASGILMGSETLPHYTASGPL